MADRQHRAAEPRHQPLEQLTAGEVEVRLRLVEQEELGSWTRQPTRPMSLRCPPREQLRGEVELPHLEPDAQQHGSRSPLERWSAAALVPLEERRLGRERRVPSPSCRRRRPDRRLRGHGREAGVDLGEVRAGVAHRLERRALVAHRVLEQEREAQPPSAGHAAGIGLVDAGGDPEQCRLARPVRPHHADPRAIGQLEVDAVEDPTGAERACDAVQAEERHGGRQG